VTSNNLQPYLTPNQFCGALQARQRNVARRIEETVNLRPAGAQHLSEARLRDVLLLHRLFELPDDSFLDSLNLQLFKETFLLEKVVEAAADMRILRLPFSCHAVGSFVSGEHSNVVQALEM
jgi:hypothetical protein